MADVVTVFAAGNDPSQNIGGYSPQRFANPNNPLISVGAVDRQGLYSELVNAKIGPAVGAHGRDLQLKGSHTVYALGDNVDTMTPGTIIEYRLSSGTSFAAPQVAGLAAYFLTIPGLRWSPGSVAKLMKDFIVQQKRRSHLSGGTDGWDIANNAVRGALPCILGTIVRPKPRRWSMDTASISDFIAKILRRRSKPKEVVIFEKGQLTDPKFSDQVSLSFDDLWSLNQDLEIMAASILMNYSNHSSTASYQGAINPNQLGCPRQKQSCLPSPQRQLLAANRCPPPKPRHRYRLKVRLLRRNPRHPQSAIDQAHRSQLPKRSAISTLERNPVARASTRRKWP